ncbi:hypothetical protein LEP1GSC173_2596 [Leptospira interrogans str. HAI1594]|uniref:Uncharacterized protein n=4 Tax=Leptospira interrogans TaxID=173 RepID=M6KS15_LEPIR|nr:hypothetical protein LEP1GSC045_1965 [Leptospira interrogans serovar Pomona str. Kennewicki LC82-25]EJP04881.1 hypothetical protein LEP1GSC007_2857 [Leptospira interrogans serovar Bulgarica str. Mallika]EJP17911.1 hypothetical protein LEP1GSC080_0135 [Leptospira interrogans str. FPW2026]EKO26673.1 hypothetical protein LEP1GSC104_3417 [Leptospira interrogans str. UI 12621]EKO69570.1 hypothetical protein LEP1GSC069_2681 [Leptospira interrogans serovar Canicola str. Fiocruz LV133]EKP20303.1 hy
MLILKFLSLNLKITSSFILRTCPKTLKNLDNSFLEIFNKTQ